MAELMSMKPVGGVEIFDPASNPQKIPEGKRHPRVYTGLTLRFKMTC